GGVQVTGTATTLATTGDSATGVFISGANSGVTNAEGSINILGNAGLNASGGFSSGVVVEGGSTGARAIVSVLGGSADSTITIVGNGGGAASSNNRGVNIEYADVRNLSSGALANIEVTGLANAAGANV